jgi:hypothetical protein
LLIEICIATTYTTSMTIYPAELLSTIHNVNSALVSIFYLSLLHTKSTVLTFVSSIV